MKRSVVFIAIAGLLALSVISGSAEFVTDDIGISDRKQQCLQECGRKYGSKPSMDRMTGRHDQRMYIQCVYECERKYD